MSWLRAALASLLALICLASCASKPAVPPTPLEPIEALEIEFDVIWRAQLPGQARFDGESFAPQFADGIVYASSASGVVKSLSFVDGKSLWEVDLERPLSSGVSVGVQNLYVTTRDGSVLALDRELGRVRWEATLEREILQPPLVEVGQLLVSTSSGELFVLDTLDGSIRWQYRYQAPDLTVRGAGYNLRVPGGYFVALDDGRLVALDERNGRVIWEHYVSTPRGRTAVQRIVDVDSLPIVVGQSVVVGSRRGDIVSLDGRSGDQRWSQRVDSVAGISGGESGVVVVERDSTVIGLGAVDGERLWASEQLRGRRLSDPILHRGVVLVGDLDGYLHALSPQTGALTGRIRASGTALQARPVAAGEDVLVQSRKGELLRLAVVGVAQ